VDQAWAARHRLVVWRRWREHQALTQGRYVPWMQTPQQRPRFGPSSRRQLSRTAASTHIHLAALSAAERAEIMRQLRGGQLARAYSQRGLERYAPRAG